MSRLLLVTIVFIAAEARAEPANVALLPVMAPDLLEPQKRAIDARIRKVADENGLALQAAEETKKHIESAKKVGADCNIETLACQAQIGVLIGVNQVLVARVHSDWAGDRFELRLLDAMQGSAASEATQLLPKDPALRDRVLDGAVLRVLAPQKTGSIAISAPDGSDIVLDGVPLTPGAAMSTIEGLAPGPHDLEVRVAGKEPDRKSATVESGKAVKIVFSPSASEKVPPPPSSNGSVWPWVAGGGVVVAAVAGVSAGGLQAALEYNAMERGQRDALRVTGMGLLGATALGVVAATAGGILMMTEASQ